MICRLRSAYEGKRIAVLGSAPSVTLFSRKEDVVIGVNGAENCSKVEISFIPWTKLRILVRGLMNWMAASSAS